MRFRAALVAFGSAAVFAGLASCGKAEMTQQERGARPGETGTVQVPAPGGSTPSLPEGPGPVSPAPAPGPAPEVPAPPEAEEPPPPPEFSRILWVSPRGADAAEGSQAKPFRTVAKALSVVRPGEAVFLETGTYSERLKLEERGGGADRMLTVMAAPGASPVFKGGSGNGTPMIDVRGAYWRIEGLTLDLAGDRAFAVFWRGKGAHHGILRGSILKNGTEGAGVSIAESASDVLIEDNEIHHFKKSGEDSHGVVVQTTARNVVIRGNDIHHNSGDGVQCLGPEGGATVEGTPFDNLLVEDNALHENQENGVDIKTCTHVTLRHNTIWGHRRTATSAGEGVVVHLSASDVTVEDNTVRANGRGIVVGGVRVNAPPTRIVVRRNRVLDGDGSGDNDGLGIRVDTSTDVKVQHNTVWNMPGPCLVFGHGTSGPSKTLDLRNNVLAGCAVTLRGGDDRSGVVMDRNLYFRSGGKAVFRRESEDLDLDGWRAATGLDAQSVEKAPAFVDVDSEDFTPGPDSPAKDSGADLGLSFCGRAPDRGAVEADCP
ncbi:right-handed parallel beta-helix repeat-containing protein [Stigmatella hybrida]|uniref:right-handed parallel beta-helix repeat-containing protein n=1 Tax=Stigmatella hybrida TaxID=394097 RepID=UPI001CDAA033|nr:right-handed parallel beta-helix repeat-containing protein [Stigmatella hybrida]